MSSAATIDDVTSVVADCHDQPRVEISAPDGSSVGDVNKPHVARDIDGREISDDHEKIDLKFVLAHSPNLDDEDDDGSPATGTADGDDGSPATGTADGLCWNDDDMASSTSSAALIESQFQPIDDDDVEYGDCIGREAEDDLHLSTEATAAACRQRRSSLKHAPRSPSIDKPVHDFGPSGPPPTGDSCTSPTAGGSSSGRSTPGSGSGGSIHERKAVHFADGPSLEERHELVSSDEPPVVPASALKDLKIRRRKVPHSTLALSLDFEQPGSDPGFVARVLKEKVALENCIAPSDRPQRITISGTVRVANVAFDKRVDVRWTIDGWSPDGLGTFNETATYMPESSDGGTDRFAFIIRPSTAAVEFLSRQLNASVTQSSRLEFVISFESGGVTYWDNNDGHNYGIEVVGSQPTASCSCDVTDSS